ncbi:ATP-binding protein [Nocardiopsis composta]|uniref:Serine/threonine-protein kinase RsbW n=1 Tax=Nocardiopsis composta TaxID=157465 RepID=A0A7W8QMT7_9ACTN|nr:ATP-binding protein [Nocardiopsis composta]MBB5433327.1 serine/threonine-protein kinase RsbW [Nocardiopsis composta]
MDDGISFALPTEPGSLPVMRRILGRALGERGITGDRAFRLLTAATEACTNAVEHGARGAYRVEVRFGAADCRIAVAHRGPGFAVPAPRMPGPDAESGRGLPMMRRLVDEVDFDCPPPGRTGRTLVRLRERLPEREPCP